MAGLSEGEAKRPLTFNLQRYLSFPASGAQSATRGKGIQNTELGVGVGCWIPFPTVAPARDGRRG
jgi:hypothetical protein